jgi:tetratricopeptide (TPR) repeat protein
MDFCKYHPVAGATHYCCQCNIHQCDKCIDVAHNNADARCILCNSALESLGATNTVEPFWRRLPAAFKYPLNASSMSLIIGTSIISVLATLMPFLLILSILMYLFAAGSMLKYSFSCLERTALGEMKAPDVIDAYQGGIKLLFQLVLIIIILCAVVGVVGYYLGNGIGGFLLVIAIVAFPAILIRFAQTESMLAAVNPLQALALIIAIGLPYGLLIAFILIMISSVGVLHQLIGQLFPAISYLLQSIISNYYTVVLFHLMGYVLFQFQGQLGYIASESEERPLVSAVEQLAAKIDVFLKEGDYEQVVKLYYIAFKQYPAEANFYERYFELLYACKKTALMKEYGTDYLLFLIKKKRFDKVTIAYKQILMVAPEFVPELPEVRVQLAQQLKQQGDLKRTIKLLNGMHKRYPEFTGLVDAYELLADALDDFPGMQAQAVKCREWVVQFTLKAAQRAAQAERDAEQLAFTEKTSDTSPANAPKLRRQNPAMKSSGIILELVPIELDAPSA